MWYKYLIIAFSFYIFALLQSSFFPHFNLWGAAPNLVFIFFILLVFFENENRRFQILDYAFMAGLLLDIFSTTDIGVSVVLLAGLGLGVNWAQTLLFGGNDQRPFSYFMLLFFVSFLAYDLLLNFYFYPMNIRAMNTAFGLGMAGRLVYSLVFAAGFFLVYKKLFANIFNNRQLTLFKGG